MGERMTGLKRISKDLASMFNNIENHLGSFVFLFNKFIPRETPDKPLSEKEVTAIKEKLQTELKDAYAHLSTEDKLDKGFEKFYNAITKSARPSKVKMIDPFDKELRELLLEGLVDASE